MNISLDNYEAFFLDYREGNLSAEQEQELFLFLEQHPYLREELDAYEGFVLSADELLLQTKAELKKREFDDGELIAYVENIVSEDTRFRIETMAARNKAFQKELLYYRSTRLEPDASLRFKNKSKLRRGGVIVLWQETSNVWKAAAALLLLLGFYFLFNIAGGEGNPKPKAEVAEKKIRKQENESRKHAPGIQRTNEPAGKTLAEKHSDGSNFPVEKMTKPATTGKKMQEEKEVQIAHEVQKASPEIPSAITEDTLLKRTALAANPPVREESLPHSYFNLSRDTDDDRQHTSTASARPVKKSFFHKLAKAAKDVNILGIQKVDGAEQENTSTVSIGSLVVTETTE